MEVDNSFRWDNCPLCRSGEVRSCGAADYRGRVKFSTQAIDLLCVPEIWLCSSCGSGFTQNIIPEAISKSLYSTSQAGDRWSSTPFEQHKTPEVVTAITDLFHNRGRVLDVGCNTGELLDFANSLGCQTRGLEYSQDSCEVIRSKGHKAYQSFDEVTEQFELITAFDLVEHLYDVPGFLAACYQRLVDGGKLILLTGDIQSQSAIRAGSRWWYAQYPEHIVFPSRVFFEKHSCFKLEAWLPSYAAAEYNYPAFRVLLSRLKSLLTGRLYNGLPSSSPDHALIILTKVDL
jgi:SAM-dependent methyltransferase